MSVAVKYQKSSTSEASTGRRDSFRPRLESASNIEPPPRLVESDDQSADQTGTFMGGIFNCLRPVWAMVGKPVDKSMPGFGTISLNDVSGLEFLTSGAQGAIYSGAYRSRMVAVKKVKERREVDTINQFSHLTHPNIVHVLGVSWSPLAIVMELCPHGSLFQMLKSDTPIAPLLTVDWARQIAGAMAYLHDHRIIHRDLKSPNCLIGPHNEMKLIDFGNCKRLTEASEIMSFTGTYAWMAPEVIRNEQCSEKIDVWSYGVVIWELLTRLVPYHSVDSSAIIWGVGSSRLHLPIPVSCPPALRALLQLCWRQEPKERPSFRHMLTQLDIAAVDFVQTPLDTLVSAQAAWRDEVRAAFIQMKNQPPPAEILNQHRRELRKTQETREQYEKKLSRANCLMTELHTVILQLETREKQLSKREKRVEQLEKLEHLKKTAQTSLAHLDQLIPENMHRRRGNSVGAAAALRLNLTPTRTSFRSNSSRSITRNPNANQSESLSNTLTRSSKQENNRNYLVTTSAQNSPVGFGVGSSRQQIARRNKVSRESSNGNIAKDNTKAREKGKQLALSKWNNCVQNSILSSSLDRGAKLSNVPSTVEDEENRLSSSLNNLQFTSMRRLSRSLNNLYQPNDTSHMTGSRVTGLEEVLEKNLKCDDYQKNLLCCSCSCHKHTISSGEQAAMHSKKQAVVSDNTGTESDTDHRKFRKQCNHQRSSSDATTGGGSGVDFSSEEDILDKYNHNGSISDKELALKLLHASSTLLPMPC